MSAIREALERKYSPPEYFLFKEFTLFADRRSARRLDALAISPWAARGFDIRGFEIKENRADWLRELNNPHKGDEGSAYCDSWTLVAPRGVAEATEVPETWGFLELRGAKLFWIKQPPELKPVPIDRPFMARILSVLGARDEELKRNERWQLEVKIKADLAESHTRDITRERNKSSLAFDTLQRRVKAFEDASGLSIDNYEAATKVGPLVKQALAGQLKLPNLAYSESILTDTLFNVREAINSMTLLTVKNTE